MNTPYPTRAEFDEFVCDTRDSVRLIRGALESAGDFANKTQKLDGSLIAWMKSIDDRLGALEANVACMEART